MSPPASLPGAHLMRHLQPLRVVLLAATWPLALLGGLIDLAAGGQVVLFAMLAACSLGLGGDFLYAWTPRGPALVHPVLPTTPRGRARRAGLKALAAASIVGSLLMVLLHTTIDELGPASVPVGVGMAVVFVAGPAWSRATLGDAVWATGAGPLRALGLIVAVGIVGGVLQSLVPGLGLAVIGSFAAASWAWGGPVAHHHAPRGAWSRRVRGRRGWRDRPRAAPVSFGLERLRAVLASVVAVAGLLAAAVALEPLRVHGLLAADVVLDNLPLWAGCVAVFAATQLTSRMEEPTLSRLPLSLGGRRRLRAVTRLVLIVGVFGVVEALPGPGGPALHAGLVLSILLGSEAVLECLTRARLPRAAGTLAGLGCAALPALGLAVALHGPIALGIELAALDWHPHAVAMLAGSTRFVSAELLGPLAGGAWVVCFAALLLAAARRPRGAA